MRLGVLDIGADTVDFRIVDASQGASPLPVYFHRSELYLGDHMKDGHTLSRDGARRLRKVVSGILEIAEDQGAEELVAFATSTLRNASNGDEVLARLRQQTGAEIAVLPAEHEARLMFLAARRWFGWSSGKLLMLNVGSGSLEVAAGRREEPDVVITLSLGAGPLTRDWLTHDPPSPDEVRQLRKYIRSEIARYASDVRHEGSPNRAVATSETFEQLAAIAENAPPVDGQYEGRLVSHANVTELSRRLAKMSTAQRTELPGVSRRHARQLVAGALVADAAMDLFGLRELEICPWALQEGVILRRMDLLSM